MTVTIDASWPAAQVVTALSLAVANVNRAGDPVLFRRGADLVRIARDDEVGVVTSPVSTPAGLIAVLRDEVSWTKTTSNGVIAVGRPDFRLAEVWLRSEVPDSLPSLKKIVRHPFIDADGRLVDRQGYDPATGTWLEPYCTCNVGTSVTEEDVRDACHLLFAELLGDFPFVSRADRANAVAGVVLTPLLRDFIPGPVPFVIFDKPKQRTGASLLAKTLYAVVMGRMPEASGVEEKGEEELTKWLTTQIFSLKDVILIDNYDKPLRASALAAAVTADRWSERMMRTLEERSVPVRNVFVMTGNNIALDEALAARALITRLDAQLENPDTRSTFGIPQLERYVLTHGRRYLEAALVLAVNAVETLELDPTDSIAHLASGMYHGVTPADFGAWLTVMRAAYSWTRLSEAVWGNREEGRRSVTAGDEDTTKEFAEAWWATNRSEEPLTTPELTAALRITGYSPVAFENKTSHWVGAQLKKLKGQRVTLEDGTRLKIVMVVGRGRKRWHVEVLDRATREGA